MATLTIPEAIPSPAEDCEQLRKAFQGWGTNEALIISILAHRNAAQRRAIREAYAQIYGEELLKSLDDDISGDFERAVILWTLDPAERDAALANEAVRKWQPSDRVLISAQGVLPNCLRRGRRTMLGSSGRSKRTWGRTPPETSGRQGMLERMLNPYCTSYLRSCGVDDQEELLQPKVSTLVEFKA